jgi:predicted CopG family antitoxin
MKKKKYLQGITFFVGTEMYEEMKKISDQREISLSEFLRELVGKHLTAANDTAANTRDDESLSIVE